MDEEDKKDQIANGDSINIVPVNTGGEIMANLGFKDRGSFSRIGN